MASNAILSLNKEHNGMELKFHQGYEIPADEKRVLSELGFIWHRKGGYYYRKYDAKVLQTLQLTFSGCYKQTKSAVATEKSIAKAMKAEAEARKAKGIEDAPVKTTKAQPSKKAPAKSSTKSSSKSKSKAQAPSEPDRKALIDTAIAALTALAATF